MLLHGAVCYILDLLMYGNVLTCFIFQEFNIHTCLMVQDSCWLVSEVFLFVKELSHSSASLGISYEYYCTHLSITELISCILDCSCHFHLFMPRHMKCLILDLWMQECVLEWFCWRPTIANLLIYCLIVTLKELFLARLTGVLDVDSCLTGKRLQSDLYDQPKPYVE